MGTNKKIALEFLLIAVLVAAAGEFLALENPPTPIYVPPIHHVAKNPQPTTATPTSTAQNASCSSDLNGLTDTPPLPSGLNWLEITSTTRSDGFALDSYRNGITLSGNLWIATSTDRSLWSAYVAYLSDVLGHGWSNQESVNGHKVLRYAADGPGSTSQGEVKIKNDNLRAIWIWERNKDSICSVSEASCPAQFEIFVSDIVPLSQFIPNYQSVCPTVATRPAVAGSVLHDKISFLRNGDVRLLDVDSETSTQLTNTSGTVQQYSFSPTEEYLAYQTTNPNSIVIEKTNDSGLVQTIAAPNLPYSATRVYLYRWKADDAISFELSEPGDYIGVEQYNLTDSTSTRLNFNDWKFSTDAPDLIGYDFPSDRSFMVYTDGRQLHDIDATSLQNNMLYNSTGADGLLFSPSVSYDKNRIAFIQVTYDSGEYFHNLVVYDFHNATTTFLYKAGPNLGLNETSKTSWSADGRYAVMSLVKGSFLIDTANPSSTIQLNGGDFNWYGNYLLISHDGNVYRYDPTTSKEELLIPQASEPSYFQ